MSKNKNLELFNKLFEVELTEDQYNKGYKKSSDVIKKHISDVVSKLDKQVDDTKIFDGKKLWDDYKNKVKTTNEIVDYVVEFVIEAGTKEMIAEFEVESMFKGMKNGLVIMSALTSMIQDVVEETILNDIDDDQVEFELMFSKLFKEINDNKDFYGCSLAELFVGEIKDNGYKFILDFNDRELLRYLKVNKYVDFDSVA